MGRGREKRKGEREEDKASGEKIEREKCGKVESVGESKREGENREGEKGKKERRRGEQREGERNKELRRKGGDTERGRGKGRKAERKERR